MAFSPAINASPLILLTRAGLLDLLQSVSQEVVVPAAVATEIQQYGVWDVTVRAIAQTEWLVVVDRKTRRKALLSRMRVEPIKIKNIDSPTQCLQELLLRRQ